MKSKRKKRERTAKRGYDRVSHHPVILSSRSPITSFFSRFQFLTLYLGMDIPIPFPSQTKTSESDYTQSEKETPPVEINRMNHRNVERSV